MSIFVVFPTLGIVVNERGDMSVETHQGKLVVVPGNNKIRMYHIGSCSEVMTWLLVPNMPRQVSCVSMELPLGIETSYS
jgi:hypothetical protein